MFKIGLRLPDILPDEGKIYGVDSDKFLYEGLQKFNVQYILFKKLSSKSLRELLDDHIELKY